MATQSSADIRRSSTVAGPHACVRCGWCIEACCAGANPAGLLEAAQQLDPVLADRFGLTLCDECAECEAVCPAQLPLLECIHHLRASLA